MFLSNNSNKPGNPKDAMANEGGYVDAPLRDIKTGAVNSAEGIEDMAMRAGCNMRKMADSAGHDIKEAGQNIAARIRHSPVQYSIIAMGVGIVVGLLARR
jgi:hypothetical protein